MRYFGAVRGTLRFASVDIEYRDVVFPAGTFMCRRPRRGEPATPAVFTEPRSFDITAQKSDQPQLTFGSGIHYCLGPGARPRRAAGGTAAARPAACRTCASTATHVEARRRGHLRPGAHAGDASTPATDPGSNDARQAPTAAKAAMIRSTPRVVAHEAALHAVHHVGDGHAVVEVVDDHRTAPAAPRAQPPIGGHERHRVVGEAVADAEPHGHHQHQVDAVGLHRRRCDRWCRRQQLGAVDHATVADGALRDGDRPGVAVAVRRADVGLTPLLRPRRLGAGRRAGERLHHHHLGVELQRSRSAAAAAG